MLDRIDIHLEIPPVEVDKLVGDETLEDSITIRKRVEGVRKIQLERFKGSRTKLNSEMEGVQIKEFCKLTKESQDLLKIAAIKMNLSARSFTRILKISRTIADMANSPEILTEHIAEGLTYRPRDENV